MKNSSVGSTISRCPPAYRVSRKRPGGAQGVGVAASSMSPFWPTALSRTGDLGLPRVWSWGPRHRARAARGWRCPSTRCEKKENPMSLHHSLSRVPLRAARWSATHPWRAIGAWLAFVIIAVGLAVAIPTKSTTDADYGVGDSGKAASLVRGAGLEPLPTEDVLVRARAGTPFDEAAARAVADEVATGMRGVPAVREVSVQASPKGGAFLVDVQLARGTDDVDALQKVTDVAQEAHPDLRISQAGDVSLDNGINDRVGEDLASAEGISLPITLLLMLLA